MRKMLCILIALTVLFGGIIPKAMADKTENALFDMNKLDSGEFVFVSNDGLLWVESGQVEKTISIENIRFCDEFNGQIYVLCQAPNQGPIITRYDANGGQTGEWNIEWTGSVEAFAIHGTFFCMIIADPLSYETNLFLFNPITGGLEEHEEFLDPMWLDADEERIMFACWDGMNQVLVVYYPNEERADIASDTPTDGQPLLIPDLDACVVVSPSGYVEMVTWEEGRNHSTRTAVDGLYENTFLADSEATGVWLMCHGDVEPRFISLDALNGTGKSTLTIGTNGGPNNEEYYDAVTMAFQVTHPNVTVETKTYAEVDQFRLALMSGGDHIDVILTTSSLSPYYIRSGAFADLRSFASMREIEESDDIMDWPFHFMESSEGYLPLLPILVTSGTMWKVNANLFEQLSLEVPEENWTWEDFYELASLAQKQTRPTILFPFREYIYQIYASQHIDLFSGKVELDTPEFRRLLEMEKALIDAGAMGPDMYYYLDSDEVLFNLPSIFDAQEASNPSLLFPPVVEKGEQPVYAINPYVAGVCASSNQKEIAADFIAEFYRYPLNTVAGGESLRQRVPVFFSNQLIYESIDAYGFSYDEEDMEELIRLYAHAAPVATTSVSMMEANAYAIQYLEGKINLDEAVKAMQNAIEIRLNE